LAEGGVVACIFDDFFAVEPVLNGFTFGNDPDGVPFADGLDDFLRGGGDQVIQRRKGAVAVFAGFGVGVVGIIE